MCIEGLLQCHAGIQMSRLPSLTQPTVALHIVLTRKEFKWLLSGTAALW